MGNSISNLNRNKVSGSASENAMVGGNFYKPGVIYRPIHRSALLHFVDFLHHPATRTAVLIIFFGHLVVGFLICRLFELLCEQF